MAEALLAEAEVQKTPGNIRPRPRTTVPLLYTIVGQKLLCRRIYK